MTMWQITALLQLDKVRFLQHDRYTVVFCSDLMHGNEYIQSKAHIFT